ncbi:MAG: hypothetical protein K9I26_02270 [Flavobacterium sp.]|nr:hypothetical protein [Flavobacterium sp.]
MEYIFRTDQIEILNQLIFDSSIDLNNIEKLQLIDSSVGFEVERRVFESVARKKILFWTQTYLSGKTSFLRFENVSDLVVSKLFDKKDINNDFINEITIDNCRKIIIESVYDFRITMIASEKTRIYLTDIKESKFGRGKVGGKVGFTKDELLM